MREVLHELAENGYPELLNATEEELHGLILPACITAFSDREIDVRHAKLTGEQARLFGSESCSGGDVTMKLAGLAAQGELRALQDAVGQYLAIASELAPDRFAVPPTSIAIREAGVCIDGMQIPLGRPLRHVVEYGPGLAGKRHIDEQFAMIQRGGEPFAYTAISRRSFTSAFLEAVASVRSYRSAVSEPPLKCMDEGIVAATRQLPDATADVVICANLHKADPHELRGGMREASRLLRPGGALVVRSVLTAGEAEVDAQQMIAWAHAGGLPYPIVQQEDTTRYDTVVGGHVIRGERRTLTAVIVRP